MYGNYPERRDPFRAGEAFAIISICVYGVACVFGFIMLFCYSCCRWLSLVLNIASIATACIVWALMAQAYHSPAGL